MTYDSLKCATKIHKQNISNTKLTGKEEAEVDKSEHQTPVLSLISSTINGGRLKGLTIEKIKISKREWIKQRSILICPQYVLF